MNRLKIEHGASKVRWALLKINIEESLANDIDLMCQWSNNDRKYVINELLRFALTQTEEFQKYKAERAANPSQPNTVPISVEKSVSNYAGKPNAAAKALAGQE
ncbi:MAG TPA: hypothetical protein VFP59_20355 [Candidatus Angelobacter sp.]|jgi:hypothetical protein|nr:hypothetical protein [Candidatus Angelobacter sp.]